MLGYLAARLFHNFTAGTYPLHLHQCSTATPGYHPAPREATKGKGEIPPIKRAVLTYSQGVWLEKKIKVMCGLRIHFPSSIPGWKMLGSWHTAASHSW